MTSDDTLFPCRTSSLKNNIIFGIPILWTLNVSNQLLFMFFLSNAIIVEHYNSLWKQRQTCK